MGKSVALPDLPPETSGAAAIPDLVVTCRVCQRAYAKYTCPRCFTRYCALSCYKTHNGRCVESFHGDNLGDAMKGLTVEDEEKKRMTEILAKYARQDEDGDEERDAEDDDDGDDDDDDDANDGGEGDTATGVCVLSEAVLEKLARGEDLLPEDLTPAERAAFERAAASGELSHMMEPWTAWWTLPEARDISLGRDGSKMIAVVEVVADTNADVNFDVCARQEVSSSLAVAAGKEGVAGSRPRRSTGAVPLPPDAPLPPLSRLTSAKPSPALRWHLLDVLGAYTLTLRAHDGDWGAEPSAALAALVSLSTVLAAGMEKPAGVAHSNIEGIPSRYNSDIGGGDGAGVGTSAQLPGTASAALHGVASRAAAAPSGVMASAAAAAAAGAMLRDVHDVLQGGRGAVVVALADVHRMVRAAASEIAEGSGSYCQEGAARAGRGGQDKQCRDRGGAGMLKRGALSRLERKVFFLLCWANALVDEPNERERERGRSSGMFECGGREEEHGERKEVWSLAGLGEETERGEDGTFELLRRRIEREMRTHAQSRPQLQSQHRQATGAAGGGGGGGGGSGGTLSGDPHQRRLVVEL